MKKFILGTVVILFLLCGCGRTHEVVAPSPYQLATHGSVKLVTKKNLENWKVVMQPDFSLTTTYIGNATTSDETVSLLGSKAESGAEQKGKHSGISFGPNPNGMIVYNGDVRVILTWYENGKSESGYAVFHVKNTK